MRHGFDAEAVSRGDAETRLWTRTHLPSFVELNPPIHALSRAIPCASAPWRLCVETNPGASRIRAVVLNGLRGMLFNCVQEVGSTRLFRLGAFRPTEGVRRLHDRWHGGYMIEGAVAT